MRDPSLEPVESFLGEVASTFLTNVSSKEPKLPVLDEPDEDDRSLEFFLGVVGEDFFPLLLPASSKHCPELSAVEEARFFSPATLHLLGE